ncbi:hypothetical protein JDV02_000378 [Purpureocillium takamizusanense]|uniref:Uncharacterized protein n=1 Tax=Purpureocillium takamizusanense TaxID=2060973 RepID=A0A9Q8V5F3_9HYPO|nr:uncharacterized protein JDV02_000378 [Purpureocillium takamizusanense]UNI13655.1 hypothetical protein JDV02_000378 [Purpureocillium takamizusanense]
MPQIPGTFYRQSSSVIIATFVISSGSQTGTYTFFGTLLSTVNPFTTNNVTLQYSDIGKLVGHHQFNGYFGEQKFELILENGPIISGDINAPFYIPPTSISGYGVWEPSD